MKKKPESFGQLCLGHESAAFGEDMLCLRVDFSEADLVTEMHGKQVY